MSGMQLDDVTFITAGDQCKEVVNFSTLSVMFTHIHHRAAIREHAAIRVSSFFIGIRGWSDRVRLPSWVLAVEALVGFIGEDQTTLPEQVSSTPIFMYTRANAIISWRSCVHLTIWIKVTDHITPIFLSTQLKPVDSGFVCLYIPWEC
jgi:hypothetical protein